MAKLERRANGVYRIRFSYGGRQWSRSLHTDDDSSARAICGQVDAVLWRLSTRQVTVPTGIYPIDWIMSGGSYSPADSSAPTTIGDLIDRYSSAHPMGTKAAETTQGEEIHFRHLLKHLGENHSLAGLSTAEVQKYADARARSKWRGRPISGATIKKELRTLSNLWGFAESRGWVAGRKPTLGIRLPRPPEKEPFRTFAECKASGAWGSCFLSGSELAEFLDHAHGFDGWIYPVVAACAYSGLRRAEWIRSQVKDWDLKRRTVTIRERKRVHNSQGSFRHVELHPQLIGILSRWLKVRPHGPLMFGEVTRDVAADRWRVLVKGSKWKGLKGYHILRHSFASNLALAGVDATVIDRWMGHQTEEQRRRYRHLFPVERTSAIGKLVYARKAGSRSR